MQTKVKYLATIHTGVYLNETSDGEIRYLQVRHFDSTNGKYLGAYPSISHTGKIEKYILSEGNLLFAAKSFVNFCTVFQAEWGKAVAASSFLVLKIIDQTIVSPDYLSWTLNRTDLLSMFQKLTAGSVMPSITKVMLEELEIDVPPIEKQQLIISIANLQQQERRLRERMADLREKLINNMIIKNLTI